MNGPPPFVFDRGGEAKRFAPATERNRGPIAAVLRGILPPSGLILEVASGTGEHIIHFAQSFPHLQFQPSDADPVGLASIEAWRADSKASNVNAPLLLDAAAGDWPIESVQAIMCINMVHIAPWEAAVGLFAGARRILDSAAPLYLYGPFTRGDLTTSQSNLAFDASLKERNPLWGLRSLEDVVKLAGRHDFVLEQVIEMPAHNLSLIFR
jgi:hypothetical protein